MAGLPSIFLSNNLSEEEKTRLTEDLSHGILRLSDLERICRGRLEYTSLPIDTPEWALQMAFKSGEKSVFKTLLDAVTKLQTPNNSKEK